MADALNLSNSTQVTRGSLVPTKILENSMLSETSEACDCFVDQQFSANLQTFLINYVVSISGNYSVYS
jgi:hypothetical protein